MSLRPGEIYWADDGEAGRHLFVVVSREELNRGDYIIALMFTSTKLEQRRKLPNCVPFRAGQFGLPENCVAQAESITYLCRSDFDFVVGRVGFLDEGTMRDIVRAIGFVLSAECEPV